MSCHLRILAEVFLISNIATLHYSAFGQDGLRKWREIDLQPSCWLQLALPGWCLVSLHFLQDVSLTTPVHESAECFDLDIWYTDELFNLKTLTGILSHLECQRKCQGGAIQ